MPKQTIVILDNPPLESDGWATEVFQKASLTIVSNEAIAKQMSKDPATRDALMKGEPASRADELAPFYKKALAKLHGGDARLGLYGTAWLVYAKPVDACVVDWSELERLAKSARAPATPEQVKGYAQSYVRNRVKKYLSQSRALELALNLTPAQKTEQSMAFLKKLKLL